MLLSSTYRTDLKRWKRGLGRSLLLLLLAVLGCSMMSFLAVVSHSSFCQTGRSVDDSQTNDILVDETEQYTTP